MQGLSYQLCEVVFDSRILGSCKLQPLRPWSTYVLHVSFLQCDYMRRACAPCVEVGKRTGPKYSYQGESETVARPLEFRQIASIQRYSGPDRPDYPAPVSRQLIKPHRCVASTLPIQAPKLTPR